MIKRIYTKNISTLHELRDENKKNKIRDDMRNNGWTGRPVIVVKTFCGDYQALTGTHRICAADEINLPVNAYILDISNICIEMVWNIDSIMRNLESFCFDLADYNLYAANLLEQDLYN
jgi:hypothetical protein